MINLLLNFFSAEERECISVGVIARDLQGSESNIFTDSSVFCHMHLKHGKYTKVMFSSSLFSCLSE